jgi:hypothetical protein
MKNSFSALLYFSGGFPSKPTDVRIKKLRETKSNLFPNLSEPKQKANTDMANNPKNWDETWFCNYE